MKDNIRKDYPTTGVLKLSAFAQNAIGFVQTGDQEGLPDYWGIETECEHAKIQLCQKIRKDYPTTGVLKLFHHLPLSGITSINQEGLPVGVLKLIFNSKVTSETDIHQEGLPAYWGIETSGRSIFHVL